MTAYTTEIEIVNDNFLETNEHFFVRLEIASSEVPISILRNQTRIIITSDDREFMILIQYSKYCYSLSSNLFLIVYEFTTIMRPVTELPHKWNVSKGLWHLYGVTKDSITSYISIVYCIHGWCKGQVGCINYEL